MGGNNNPANPISNHSYQYWFSQNCKSNFNKRTSDLNKLCMNISINITGSPTMFESYDGWYVTPTSDDILSCNITVAPPVLVMNLLAMDVEVRICRGGTEISSQSPQMIRSGSTANLYSIHPTDEMWVEIRKLEENSLWSSTAVIYACNETYNADTSTVTYSLDMKEKANGSVLSLLLDVEDRGGCRSIYIYVPYWLVNISTVVPLLEFKHDVDEEAEFNPNGCDGLAADQINAMSDHDAVPHTVTTNINRTKNKTNQSNPWLEWWPFSLLPSTANNNPIDQKSHAPLSPPPHITNNNNNPSIGLKDVLQFNETNEINVHSIQCNSNNEILRQFSLYHFSYTDIESKSTRIHIRTPGYGWSSSIPILESSYQSIDLIRINNIFNWSNNNSNNDNNFTLNEHASNAYYKSISLTTSTISDSRFHRTKVVLCRDRYVIVNGTNEPLDIRQIGYMNTQNIIELQPGKHTALSWGRGTRNIQVKRSNIVSSVWSGSLPIDISDDCTFQLRDRKKLEVQYLTLRGEKNNGCTILRLINMVRKYPPYRIDNHTNKKLRYRQRTWGNTSITQILPYHSCAFALDEPMHTPMILIEQFIIHKLSQNQDSRTSGNHNSNANDIDIRGGTWKSLSVVSFPTTHSLGDKNNEKVSVVEDIVCYLKYDVTNVFVLSIEWNNATATIPPSITPSKTSDSIFEMTFFAPTVGVSILDETPLELLYISLIGINLSYNMQLNIHNINFNLNDLQIDNQILSSISPKVIQFSHQLSTIKQKNKYDFYKSLLSPQSETASNNQLPLMDPTIQLSCEVSTVSNQEIIIFDKIFLKLLPSIIVAESELLIKMMTLGEKLWLLLQDKEIDRNNTNHNRNITSLDDNNNNTNNTHIKEKLFDNIQKKYILNLKINSNLYNINKSILIHQLYLSDIHTNITVISDPTQKNMNLLIPLLHDHLNPSLIILLSVIMQLQNCSLDFQPINFKYSLFHTPEDLFVFVFQPYIIQILYQIFKIVGASTMIGQPMNLLLSLQQNVSNLFFLPLRHLGSSPSTYCMSTLKDLQSIISDILYVITDSTYNIQYSTQHVLEATGLTDIISLHDTKNQKSFQNIIKFIEIRDKKLYTRESESNNAHNNNMQLTVAEKNAIVVVRGNQITKLSQCAPRRPNDILQGVTAGIRGLIIHPINGLATNGLRGMARGAFQGVLGLFVKPLYGLLNTSSNTLKLISTWSMENTVKSMIQTYHKNNVSTVRVRTPRYFRDPLLPLKIYRAEDSLGVDLLSRIYHGKYMGEGCVCWFHPVIDQKDCIIIITARRILLILYSFDKYHVEWDCPLDTVASFEIIKNDRNNPILINNNDDNTSPIILRIYYFSERYSRIFPWISCTSKSYFPHKIKTFNQTIRDRIPSRTFSSASSTSCTTLSGNKLMKYKDLNINDSKLLFIFISELNKLTYGNLEDSYQEILMQEKLK